MEVSITYLQIDDEPLKGSSVCSWKDITSVVTVSIYEVVEGIIFSLNPPFLEVVITCTELIIKWLCSTC